MISHIARTCFPELASSRLQEVQADREKFMAVLPVFYCESDPPPPTLPLPTAGAAGRQLHPACWVDRFCIVFY